MWTESSAHLTCDSAHQSTTKSDISPSLLLDHTRHDKEKITISNVALYLIDPKSQLSKCFQSAK